MSHTTRFKIVGWEATTSRQYEQDDDIQKTQSTRGCATSFHNNSINYHHAVWWKCGFHLLSSSSPAITQGASGLQLSLLRVLVGRILQAASECGHVSSEALASLPGESEWRKNKRLSVKHWN